jgi:folate-dependent phosphoribosylglycinamide formyltransferase PurN
MSYVYTPQNGRKMRVVFFFSGGASSMEAVLESPEHGQLYEVVRAFTNRSRRRAEKGYGIAEAHGVPVVHLRTKDYDSREQYYEEAVGPALREIGPDVIGLSGFLKKYSFMPEQFVRGEYRCRILNVHPAEMSIIADLGGMRAIDIGRDGINRSKRYDANTKWQDVNKLIENGWERVYRGGDAVNTAVLFGESEVCSSVHSVTEVLDGGPVLVQSERLPVDTESVEGWLDRNAFDMVGDYAHELQGEMKTTCDAPAFIRALGLLASGKLKIHDDHVEYGGKDLPYGGYQLGGKVLD